MKLSIFMIDGKLELLHCPLDLIRVSYHSFEEQTFDPVNALKIWVEQQEILDGLQQIAMPILHVMTGLFNLELIKTFTIKHFVASHQPYCSSSSREFQAYLAKVFFSFGLILSLSFHFPLVLKKINESFQIYD